MVAPLVLTLVPMADSSGGGGGLALLLPLILIVGMIWFMSRSQRKQRQRQTDTVARLQPGTRVITTSGQVGVVDEVEDEYVVLEIAPDVFSRFVKQAIGRVLDDPATALADETPAATAGTTAAATTDSATTADEPLVTENATGHVQGVEDVQDVKDRTDAPTAKPTTPPTHTES